jgi:hypothetical protein
MAKNPYLVSVMSRKGKFLGSYRCSHCDAEFRPNKPGEVAATFAIHVQQAHPPDRTTREDVNQAAEEATKD